MSQPTNRVHMIETLALRAWPAATVTPLDGWQLRQDAGSSRRVNSVWPNASGGALRLGDKLAQVEAFYARHSQPARYQVSPANMPATLDASLAARGYWVDAPTHVQTASLARVLDSMARNPKVNLILTETLTPEWLQTYGDAENHSATKLAQTEATLQRITRQVVYALAFLDGVPAAVGRGVLDTGWLGIFGMATRITFRRRGLASNVLGALVAWAHTHAAGDVYLQVMENNTGARALYARAGFETLYGYHYRTQTI